MKKIIDYAIMCIIASALSIFVYDTVLNHYMLKNRCVTIDGTSYALIEIVK